MLYIGTYGAFGELLDSTGSTENAYGFTGEQFDSGLDQYYLRARYYNQNSGRFTRRDDYEGRQGEPLTLHKYLYGNGNPVNGIDPTGNHTETDLGNFVHARIGQDFEDKSPNPGNHLNNPTVRQILEARRGAYTVGRSGNRRQPDLADIPDQQLYEVKKG